MTVHPHKFEAKDDNLQLKEDLEHAVASGHYLNITNGTIHADNVKSLVDKHLAEDLLEIVKTVKSYVLGVQDYFPQVMRVATKKQGKTREDRKADCRNMSLDGLPWENLEALVYLSLMNTLLAIKFGSSASDALLPDESLASRYSNIQHGQCSAYHRVSNGLSTTRSTL